MIGYEEFDCLDCGVSTLENLHYYMVRDNIWEALVGDGDAGMLCLDCLQHRAKRPLIEEDFDFDIPVNEVYGLRKWLTAGLPSG